MTDCQSLCTALAQAPCASGSKTLLSSSASQQDIEAGDEQRSRKQKVGCPLLPPLSRASLPCCK